MFPRTIKIKYKSATKKIKNTISNLISSFVIARLPIILTPA